MIEDQSNKEEELKGWRPSYTLIIVMNTIYILFFLWVTLKYAL